MKIKVAAVKAEAYSGQYGPTTKYSILNELDNQWYSAFAKPGYTDKLTKGYEFDAEVQSKPGNNGKIYRNIKWPSNKPFTPSNTQLNDAMKIQLDRIERKLDRLLDEQHHGYREVESEGLPTGEPPPHTDEDNPEGDLPF